MRRQNYSRSRFSKDCEPMTPYARCSKNQSKSSSIGIRMMEKDTYDETGDFCQDMLKKIQEKYEKSMQMTGPKDRVIISMKQILSQMESKAKKIGVDPEKVIETTEYNAAAKAKILDDIMAARNLINVLELLK